MTANIIEKVYNKHKEIFEGKSPTWISGWIAGFLYFLAKERGRHLKDYFDITCELLDAQEMGFDIPAPEPDEWWELGQTPEI